MSNEQALNILCEMINRAPKNGVELAGVEVALKYVQDRFKELETLRATPPPAKD